MKLLPIIGLPLFLGVVAPPNAENPFVEIEVAESAADVAKKRLSDLFRKIMRNPASDELNLAYAQLAGESGFANKAIAAYQRILAGDPKNITAKNELDRLTRLLEAKRKEPKEQTRFTVRPRWRKWSKPSPLGRQRASPILSVTMMFMRSASSKISLIKKVAILISEPAKGQDHFIYFALARSSRMGQSGIWSPWQRSVRWTRVWRMD
ncbi:MAG TPA: hypothetical protein ENI79_03950 [Rhodospirillales bacterium]|nr:hypothetical protein [Rhodospirillales bacterium]